MYRFIARSIVCESGESTRGASRADAPVVDVAAEEDVASVDEVAAENGRESTELSRLGDRVYSLFVPLNIIDAGVPGPELIPAKLELLEIACWFTTAPIRLMTSSRSSSELKSKCFEWCSRRSSFMPYWRMRYLKYDCAPMTLLMGKRYLISRSEKHFAQKPT